MFSPFSLKRKKADAAPPQEPKKPSVSKKTAPSVQVPASKAPQPESRPLSSTPSTTMITTEQIKQLRDQTGVSIMQCKKALEEANGDFEKALVILRKKSGEISAKKGDRTFRAGAVEAYIHASGDLGTIIELDCESDFVSGNAEFRQLARDIAMHITATNPKFLKKEDITEADKKTAREVFEGEVKGKPEAVREKILEGKLNAYFAEMVLMDQPFIKNSEVTIQGLIDTAVQKFGEKIAVSRFKRFKALEV